MFLFKIIQFKSRDFKTAFMFPALVFMASRLRRTLVPQSNMDLQNTLYTAYGIN